VIQRRHWQQAASNDARFCPELFLDKGANRREHKAVIDIARLVQLRRVIGPRNVAQAQEIIAAGQAARR